MLIHSLHDKLVFCIKNYNGGEQGANNNGNEVMMIVKMVITVLIINSEKWPFTTYSTPDTPKSPFHVKANVILKQLHEWLSIQDTCHPKPKRAIAIVFSCPPEVDGKTLSLKIPHTLVIGNTQIKLLLTGA